MYKIILSSNEAGLEAMDTAGRCLVLLSQAGELRFEIEWRTSEAEEAMLLVEPLQPSAGNPISTYLVSDGSDVRSTLEAAAQMLSASVHRPELSALLRSAMDEALAAGMRGSGEPGERVQAELAEQLGARHAHLQLMAMNRGCCG